MISNNNSVIYKCTLPNENPLDCIHDAFERYDPKDPVVVLLDPQQVMDLIDIVFGPFNPHQRRLDSIDRMLNASNFVLPIIVFNGASNQILDGRHRTAALHYRSEPVIPFLTVREMAPIICRGLGSFSPPSKFDFSETGYPVYIPE